MQRNEGAGFRQPASRNAQSILLARQAELALTAVERRDDRGAELWQQREWFRVTLASVDDAVLTTGADGNVTCLNAAAERMTGWAAVDAIGRPFDSVAPLVDERSGRALERPLDRVLLEGRIVSRAEQVELVRRDGTRVPAEDTAAPIRDAGGRIVGAVVVVHDLTERRLTAAARQDLDRRKDELLATLAHELRNPLAPIHQAVLIAESPTASEAQKHWSHDVIVRQVRHLATLLDQLLDASRLTRGTLALRQQPARLDEVVGAAVATVRSRLDAKGHELTVDLPADPVLLHADPLRLTQVFANLLDNAVKFTEPRGSVTVHARRAGDEVVVAVRDTGCGLADDARARLFEMFAAPRRANGSGGSGLGVGLALAKGLVELHGGSLAVASEGPGRGSEFAVRLPVAGAVPERAPDGAARADAAPPRRRHASRRVLIADDNRDAAASLAMLLRGEGHDVAVAHDGERALALLESREARPIEFAVLDIGMPKLDGYEIARRIRRRRSGGPTLIALTGWGQQADKERAAVAGFDHHFTKPVDPAVLLELLTARPHRARAGADEPR